MIQLKLISALGKIFPDESCESPLVLKSMLQNETFCFQLQIYNDNDDVTSGYTISVSENVKNYITIYKAECVPSVLATNVDSDDYHLRKTSGMYPDLLLPLRQDERFVCPPRRYTGLFFEVRGLEVGEYPLRVTVREVQSGELEDVCFTLTVLKGKSAPADDFPVTTWLYHDCIAQTHHVRVFSKRHYQIFGKYLQSYVAHGNNTLMVPLFTYPLNVLPKTMRQKTQLVKVAADGDGYAFDFSDLKYYLDFIRGYGVKYFEMSHLFSQWGGKFAPPIYVERNGKTREEFGWAVASTSEKYTNFLRAFLPELVGFLKREKIFEYTFFHLSDEPNKNTIENYAELCGLVKPYLEGRPIIDALSDYDFYGKGLVDIPVVSINRSQKFVENGANYWVYYCWEHANGYVSNRFFSMPSLRTRILGLQLFKNDAKGFLQWGYNYYTTAFGERAINPFFVTDCDKKFPSGDAFIVYPNVAKRGVFESIRNLVFAAAMEDYRALRTAERLCGREKVDELLKGMEVKGFSEYVRDDGAFQIFREKLNRLISLYYKE